MKTFNRKCLMAFLVLSATMVSCQKTGPDAGMARGSIIPRVVSGETPTKGGIVTTSGLNVIGKKFRMDAWLGSANRYDGTQDGDGLVYDANDKDNYHFISSETVKYGSGSWSMGAEYSWRNSVPTSFWSLYPESATGWTVTLPGETASDDEQKQLSFIYTIPSLTDGAGAEGQPDLCVAFSHKTWEDGSDHFVDIDFKHALSAVLFDVTDIPDGITVTDIAIKGIKGAGSCTVTGSTDGTASSKGVTFAWTPTGSDRSWSQTYSDSDFETVGERKVTKESGTKIFMLIPQTLTSDFKLAVTFSDGTSTTTKEAVIGDGTTSFKAGNKYTFRLSVKEGELTAEIVEDYNGSRLGGDELDGDNENYNGGRTGGDDINGGNENYNGGNLGGGSPSGGTTPYNGSPLGGDVHDYVDLGLSVLWATCNVGATSPEEYGGYYQWAGTEDVTSISVSLANCPYHSGSSETDNWTKYVTSDQSSYWGGTGSPDNKTVLDSSDDVAHESWGDNWRMPTLAEYEELITNCTCTWEDNYNGTDIKGWLFTSNKPGYTDSSIFLPAGGRINENGIKYVGVDIRYWTSALGTEKGGCPAYGCGIFSEDNVVKIDGYGSRFHGRNVRPVMDKD